MKKFLFVLLCVCFVKDLFAVEYMQTKPEFLNIREIPTGRIIDDLPRNSVVTFESINGEWAKITYVKDNRAFEGWVIMNDLKPYKNNRDIKHNENKDCDYNSNLQTEVCIFVRDIDFKCDELSLDFFYTKCYANIDYEIRSDYRGDDYLNIEASCRADVKYESKKVHSKRKSEENLLIHTLNKNERIDETTALLYKFSTLDEVTKVKLDSYECKIKSLN